MREIKFRIWDKWRKGMFVWDNLSDHCIPSNYKECFVLMQFTGITDCHGKDVYEGDIVQLYRHDDIMGKHVKSQIWKDGKYQDDIKQVKFCYGSFVIWSDLIKQYRCFANLARPGESLEILGNIYQNPDLLTYEF